MRFVCLLPVRDEADIIGQCLEHLLTWADEVFLFDTGSLDNTWEIIQEAARRDGRVKPLRKEPVFFSETRLRGWMFNQARQHLRDGDWFLRVDADEFHHIPPPEFVKTRLRQHETIVYHQYYNFCLLESEVQRWNAGGESLADRARPIEDRRRWYLTSVYSEPRLCRYRATMQWPPTVSFPFNAGFLARERLPIRHYPHRDPPQLERRCRLRAVMMADAQNRENWTRPELHHWAEVEWRKFVTPDNTPGLRYWDADSELPRVRLTNHLAKPHIRLAQRIAHSYFLPLLDRGRESWPDSAQPQPIPPTVISELDRLLKSDDLPHPAQTPPPATLVSRLQRKRRSQPTGPQFFALLPVRDEGDIIEQCLEGLLRWADGVFVFDTGSVDETWDIIQACAAKDSRVRPLRKENVFFSQKQVRGWLFNQARQYMRDGDWFLRVDADEFHHITPQEFVDRRMRPHETVAYHQYYDFRLVNSEAADWVSGRETVADRERPIEDRRRWYLPSIYTEPRLCRYRHTMQWPDTVTFPHNAGFMARARLPIRHYPHRDPAQLERRCRLRVAMMADGSRPRGHHWEESEWRRFVTPDDLPGLLYWKPGTELPEVHYTNHLPMAHVRGLQRLAHAFLLPLLDRTRRRWPQNAYPQRIPADMALRLEEELRRA